MIQLLKVYNIVICSIFTSMCKSPQAILKHFYYLKRRSCTLQLSVPTLQPPPPVVGNP